ncbi:unnamed protein product [Protopolystoma xenopodis]|uniref:Uncharacterized protein n=1 Tax=Protopolystoma xenopodis TaxID=117903 RepID=A0A448WCL5_9PLAT|nr:unnamed protein product [Protopolystoma xenopodis]
MTKGRYRKVNMSEDPQPLLTNIMSRYPKEPTDDIDYREIAQPRLPDFESDDLRVLGKEITKARSYLGQCSSFHKVCSKGFYNPTSQSFKETQQNSSQTNLLNTTIHQ